MLGEQQLVDISEKVNKKVNIPFLSESREGKIFLMALKKMERRIEQLLREELGDEAVKQISILLDGQASRDAKQKTLETIAKAYISRSIVPKINERLDAPFLDEAQEAQVIEKVMFEIIELVIHRVLD